ncbi:glycosyl hydrolase family 14-domain-containing protein [Globomyces pollinis-pini]|nr:glycosyl hydrolase family 14-domain-containing protein [Globomyces pollinis-pini]
MATDVWWGEVEKAGDQKFDWSYYDKLSGTIIDAGLKWIPILSTHRCGGGPGDDCDIPTPSWANINSNQNNLFVDVYGKTNADSFSPWSGDWIYKQYAEYFEAFTNQYSKIKSSIPRIDLSAGGSGELRYPSYAIDGYPTRGRLQAYSNAAVEDFRNWVMQKYNNDIGNVARSWQATGVTKRTDITPPCDVTVDKITTGVCAGKTGLDVFYSIGYKSPYGKDFAEWYQGSLIRHSSRITKAAHEKFDNSFGVPIYVKIAGIHWQYFNPGAPHGAERSAGYWDYATIFRALKEQRVGVTFTAIEMDDNNADGIFSGAKSLARQVFQTCKDVGINCAAENALKITASNVDAYRRMQTIIKDFPVTSLTVLRYRDLIEGAGGNFRDYISSLQHGASGNTGLSFVINGYTSKKDDQLKIVGDSPFVGSWDHTKGLALRPTNCNDDTCDWVGSTQLPYGAAVSWKVVVVNGGVVKWECGSNHVNTVGPTTTVVKTPVTIC